ncbi:hypothetical protein SELMODRAFT_420743 [Selaginella moellendorffii]|uniref:Uncharacterized protein n=1 Tax=Selaginella moellendorffii TaxID=88036 RepID=D8SCZ5_SELML|nr:hypothetical protein SELMODRAFT_420743 [Selaginella moellendorffii]
MEVFKSLRANGILRVLKSIAAEEGNVVSIRNLLSMLNMNNISQMAFSKQVIDDPIFQRFLAVLEESLDLMAVFVLGDFIPFLKWFDPYGYVEKMKANRKEISGIYQMIIDEHKLKRKENCTPTDLVDILLSQGVDETTIKGTIMVIQLCVFLQPKVPQHSQSKVASLVSKKRGSFDNFLEETLESLPKVTVSLTSLRRGFLFVATHRKECGQNNNVKLVPHPALQMRNKRNGSQGVEVHHSQGGSIWNRLTVLNVNNITQMAFHKQVIGHPMFERFLTVVEMINEIYRMVLDEHKLKRKETYNAGPSDLVDILPAEGVDENIIKGMVMGMLFAGTEEELDRVVGRDRHVQEEDLVYWNPPVPLVLPREST